MVDVTVKCDKPYDLDRADKARGKPRRKRKDSHTTAYELTIRLAAEQRKLLNGKKKFVTVVYARNKKEDLAAKIAAFEAKVSSKLRDAAMSQGKRVAGDEETVSNVVRAYLKSRDAVTVSSYAQEGEDLTVRYIDPTIGHIPFGELKLAQVEDALEAVPELSRKLNEEKRERQIAARAAAQEKRVSEGAYKRKYPDFQPVRVAGRPTQHKVLSLLKLAGNFAVDKGIIEYNIVNNKRLISQYPKSKPQIDNFTEDEAKYVFSKIEELPPGSRKVELQLMFMCGIRPCELLSLTFDDVNLRDPSQGVLRVVKRLKTKNSYRNITLDPDTTALLVEWKRSRVEFAKAAGVKFSGSWLVCCEDGQKTVYNTLKQRWAYFLKQIGYEHRRPYSMRHTFATMNGRNNVDVKTLAGIMGHATAGFTLNVYSGYLESAAQPVTSNYLDYLREDEQEAVQAL